MDLDFFYRAVVALGIGFLMGFQREFAGEQDKEQSGAGVRTFMVMTLLGFAGAFFTQVYASPLIFSLLLVSVSLLLGANFVMHYSSAGQASKGITTEMTALIAVCLGGMCYLQYIQESVALGVAITVILSVKAELHRFVHKVTKDDLVASLKFAVIVAIVLPVLPDKTFGVAPFDVFNPFKIWLLVVFISGISFVGFIAIKTVGAEKGIGLTGLLGGIASSTAVTLSFAQKSKEGKHLSSAFSMAIIVAWTVMFARVVVEVAVVHSELVPEVLPVLAAMAASGLLYSLILLKKHKQSAVQHTPDFANPFELWPAIKFGILFTVILFISRLAQMYFGESGVYISSFFSGLADVDAIALSVANLSAAGHLPVGVASDAIILAAIANTLAKGAIVLWLGESGLRKAILPGYLLMLATGVVGMLVI